MGRSRSSAHREYDLGNEADDVASAVYGLTQRRGFIMSWAHQPADGIV